MNLAAIQEKTKMWRNSYQVNYRVHAHRHASQHCVVVQAVEMVE
jgi:hypothetical protein